jgi:triosephosphate isomerase
MRPLVVGNWKMHGTVAFAAELAAGVVDAARAHPEVDVGVAPPFTALSAVREKVRGTAVALCAQHVHDQPQGAFTGAISAPMLADLGCSMVLVGHSERRHVFGESDEQVARQLKALLANDLAPILCVGELLAEREAGRTLDVVRRQLDAGLADLDETALRRLVVAYEPVWAIGTGKVASPGDAQEVHAFLRGLLARRRAETVRLLYGGSVKADNAAGLFAERDIDGFLVGGASLKAAEFGGIIAAAAKGKHA